MPRTIYYIDSEMEIADYELEHRYCNQALHDGIPVNPTLREGFDMTPNESRDPQEIEDWWGKPFVVTCEWSEMADTWDDYLARLEGSGVEPESKTAFDERMRERKAKWFEAWPSGVRYDVRCLDGGCWDRSTNWGMLPSLDEALALAKSGC